jgi:GGDEF domain-containing protein
VVIRIQLEEQDIQELAPEVGMIIQREIAGRLRGHLRPMDSVARFSEWKFAALHEELKKADDFKIILSRLLKTLDEPICFQDKIYRIKVSLGAVINRSDFKKPTDILDAAEKDLKNAQTLPITRGIEGK